MAFDRAAIRCAYFAPPREGPPDHVPTDEELIAAHERRMVEVCLAAGGDPVAEGLGEGDRVVVSPMSAVTDGMAVRPIAPEPQSPSGTRNEPSEP